VSRDHHDKEVAELAELDATNLLSTDAGTDCLSTDDQMDDEDRGNDASALNNPSNSGLAPRPSIFRPVPPRNPAQKVPQKRKRRPDQERPSANREVSQVAPFLPFLILLPLPLFA
jgi:hypothetical protein